MHEALRETAEGKATGTTMPYIDDDEYKLDHADKVYDLMGRKVNRIGPKHIYIYKGKKIMY